MNRIVSITVKHIPDPCPDTSYLEADDFRQRRLQYEAGEFEFFGIRAEAEIVAGGVCQIITSGGLWSVESDSDPSYLAEIAQEEQAQLVQVLRSLGFSAGVIQEHASADTSTTG